MRIDLETPCTNVPMKFTEGLSTGLSEHCKSMTLGDLQKRLSEMGLRLVLRHDEDGVRMLDFSDLIRVSDAFGLPLSVNVNRPKVTPLRAVPDDADAFRAAPDEEIESLLDSISS